MHLVHELILCSGSDLDRLDRLEGDLEAQGAAVVHTPQETVREPLTIEEAAVVPVHP